MLRRTLLGAALAVAALTPSAEAAPPYCVAVTAGGQTYTAHCAVGTYCVVDGVVLPQSPLGFAYCVRWP